MAGQDFYIAVYDVNGRKVFQKELTDSTSNETLNFNGYSSGLYILNIQQRSTEKTKSFQIIKQ
jgi:hypothetical protein